MVVALTDQNGALVERDSYDPWGKRRFLDGDDDPTNGGHTARASLSCARS